MAAAFGGHNDQNLARVQEDFALSFVSVFFPQKTLWVCFSLEDDCVPKTLLSPVSANFFHAAENCLVKPFLPAPACLETFLVFFFFFTSVDENFVVKKRFCSLPNNT